MSARMPNPAAVLPEAMPAVLRLVKAVTSGGDVPGSTLHLVHLRTSQINGCGYCVVGGALKAQEEGETDERLHAVAAWREAPYFTEAERAALALAEHATRLADRPDAVPDAVWDEAARHYDEKQLAQIVLWIGVSNLFNRLNATTRQPAGATW
ncbi:carboxymuconolactone decarboxylase family protein [Streptomyces sp. TLI_105]|uniref:carboxymuconolactone decarboxylase family protein n=1 Tax=Streptomyces sp. TLI_105 TaxID=1881019 RepID=UPI000898EA28|nr:carboxymuconolactone decarboxylase family protein [Streptomyces sp. TLI_105]SED16228.1 alkylhydroperoxidase AhpD family core domain-containing protein [Streptomyces sp. TLI_105]